MASARRGTGEFVLEQSLRRRDSAAEAALADALELMPDAVFVFDAVRDADGQVVDLVYRLVNGAALRMYHLRRDEVLGNTLGELFPSVRGSERWARYVEVINTGRTANLESYHFAERGITGSFSLTAARLNDGLIVTARDVTDRHEYEKRLRRERDFSSAVLDVAGALVIVMDADGHIIQFNREAERVSGYRELEVVGRHWQFLIPPEDRAAVAQVLGEDPAPVERRVDDVIAKSGRRIPVQWTYTALYDDAGARTHLIASGIDITEQRRSEQELARRAADLERANAELARSNEDLEQFAYVASHDLAEPLRAIAGPVWRVADRYKGKLDPESEDMLALAVDGCARMQSLIRGLLEFSRVGRLERPLVPVDADQIVTQALANLSRQLADSGAQVSVAPLPAVLAEPLQLTTVVQNLIANAVKFVAPGVAPRVRVAAERDGPVWRFTVTDNGIGIPVEQRERVFAMFRRLNARDAYPGNGIGLAMVKKIVERHGGQVGVGEPPPEGGSTLWFTLPARAESSAPGR